MWRKTSRADTTATGGQPTTLRMAKVNPLGDFSFDYEDLDLQRVGDCR